MEGREKGRECVWEREMQGMCKAREAVLISLSLSFSLCMLATLRRSGSWHVKQWLKRSDYKMDVKHPNECMISCSVQCTQFMHHKTG